MESILRKKILLHPIRNKVLSDCQHGFLPGRHCSTQLLLCLENWSKMIGEPFDVIYTDFSKAFDSVAHQRLLWKLENLWICRDVLNWVKSFLSGRTPLVIGRWLLFKVGESLEWNTPRFCPGSVAFCCVHKWSSRRTQIQYL